MQRVLFSRKFTAFIVGILTFVTSVFPSVNGVKFTVDTQSELYEVNPIVNTINCWNPYSFDENTMPDSENSVMDFVDYIELMRATGGNEKDDPFIDPLDRTVLDDYDFSRIVASCRGVLNLGAKPFLKLGNVPLKLSSDPVIGNMDSNVRPPEDYDEWYRFLTAYLGALIDEFGLDEVRSWRFGVFTEYENDEWFYVGDRDPEASFIEYCKIYDYSVKALTDMLGDDVYVGAHSMTVTEGLWDERDFIKHCAFGVNYATGEIGTHISYLTSSFYDSTIVKSTSGLRPAECIELLRSAAEDAGLYGLDYGFDEGRILYGSKGTDETALLPRAVGWNIQSAYDAKLYNELSECGASWFSSWGYTSGGSVFGYPSIAYHTAEQFSKMAGCTAVAASADAKHTVKKDKDIIAAKDSESETLYIMAYNYKQSLNYFMPSRMNFSINASEYSGKTVEIKTYYINSDCNFFDEWREDAKSYIKKGSAMSWSPDSYVLDGNITDGDLLEKYNDTLRDKYKSLSILTPESQLVECDGTLSFACTADPNTVVFVEITPTA